MWMELWFSNEGQFINQVWMFSFQDVPLTIPTLLPWERTYHCCTCHWCTVPELFKKKCFPFGHETLIPYHQEVWLLEQWVNVYSFHYKKVLCSLEKIGNKHVLSFLFHYLRIYRCDNKKTSGRVSFVVTFSQSL